MQKCASQRGRRGDHGAILGLMVALVNFMSEPAQKWFAAAPHTFRLIERKIRPFEQFMAMLARMTSAFASDLKSAHILAVIEKVRSEVGRFYATTALINVGLGLVTGFAMMLFGMPNPFLWGTMARC